MKRTVIGAAVLALGISTVGVASADKPGDDDTTKTSKTTQERVCDGDNKVFLDGPDTLWPPNHKMVQQTAIAQSNNSTVAATDGDTMLTFTPRIDDATGGDGGPQHDPDVSSEIAGSGKGRAEVPFEVRAERSGKGEGRTYIFDWSAKFSDGTTCMSNATAEDGDADAPFTIFVPHDQGKGNDT